MNKRLPIEYPWSPAAHNGLLVGDTFLRLELTRGRRLGLSRVQQLDGSAKTLNQFLVESNVAPVDRRTLVVAVGSNSSPDVMASKFRAYGHHTSLILPFVGSKVRNIAVGHSAHISKPGFIAAAPFAAPNTITHLWASWLDDAQLAALDSTEPNYVRVQLDNTSYPLLLDNDESPDSYFIYESHHGVLSDGDHPWHLTTQTRLFEVLSERKGGREVFGRGSTIVIDELAQVDTQTTVKDWFVDTGLRRSSGIVNNPSAQRTRTYGQTPSLPLSTLIDALRVRESRDKIPREGEQCVVINHQDARILNIGRHAIARPFVESDSSFSSRPGMIVKVLQEADIALGTVEVDQVIRNGLGVEKQEHLLLEPTRLTNGRLANFLLGAPQYIVCRVHAADLSTVEQNVALVDPIAMRILGLSQGDMIVIEGVPLENERSIRPLRTRACELEDQIREFRSSVSGGGLDARFPTSADALGVFPDLPQIFLDAALKAELGLGTAKLSTVRVRASRGYQLLSQMRELLLILVLAFVGLITLVEGPALIVGLLAVIGAIATLVVGGRLRSQLGLIRRKYRAETDKAWRKQ